MTWWHDQAGRFPLLTPAQEIHLGQAVRKWLDHPGPVPPAIERRGRRAMDRFVKSNLRLVISFAEKYRSVPSQYQDDLIQAGNLGLMRAVERFDPARGYKFSTYAYWWIRQGVHSFLEHYGRSIRLPTTHAAQHTKIQNGLLELTAMLGRKPTRKELADHLGWPLETLERVISRPSASMSLDAESRFTEGATVSEAIADPSGPLLDRIASAEQLEILLAAIRRLEPRSQRVMLDQFLSPQPSTLHALARREQCDRSTIRSDISRSLLILKRLLEDKPISTSVMHPEDPPEYGPQLGLPWAQ